MSSREKWEGPHAPVEAQAAGVNAADAAPADAADGTSAVLAEPVKTGGPPQTWTHRKLYENVYKTLFALPEEFSTSLRISDFRATDIFTLNSALGASIEDAVVRGLNALRDEWDPQGNYALYHFQRQAQAFPDVRLMTDLPDDDAGRPEILMGIELKGWFAMSKEGEPTFRYAITPAACADADLLVVYPWVLSDVVAGSPKLLRPFVGEARYAAELRNYYWQTQRAKNKKNGAIRMAAAGKPYPSGKIDQCSDKAEDDDGGNFGRVARYKLLDEFVSTTISQQASGIPVEAWLTFFRLFNDKARALEELSPAVEGALKKFKIKSAAERDKLIEAFEQLAGVLRQSA